MEIVTSLIYMRWMAEHNQRTLEIPRVRRLRRMAINENMREYNEYMLHEYPQGRIVEKQRGNNMLGRAYLYSSEMANSKNRKYSQRPHRGNMIKSTLQRFRDGSTQTKRGLYATLTAPIGVLTQFLVRVRKLSVNGTKMRKASVLKAGKYRKKLK